MTAVGALAPARAATRPTVAVPRWAVLLIGIGAEVAVALLLKEVPLLGAAHVIALALFGLNAVLRRNYSTLLCVLGYLTGSEVLWRQVRAPIFYLAAPYLLIFLAGLGVVLLGKIGKDGRLALLYIGLLLPATVITARTGGADARELVAFALSGPFALAALVSLTSQLNAPIEVYRRILWVTMVSTLGPLTVAVTDIREALAESGAIKFSTQSNSLTSGGFGPVQVSSSLGLGILVAVLILLTEKDRIPRIIAAFLAFALTVQTLLTFSRGGSFAVAIAITIIAVGQARNRRVRNRILLVAGVALVLAYYVVFPWLDAFTAGQFQERFSDTSSARTELAANDTQIFERNIAFGVGPGMTKYQRLTYEICQLRNDHCENEASSHTEFTRMLGEHGVPGVMAIGVLIALVVRTLKSQARTKPLALAWMGWAVAQMFYANLRVVAVPFAFGMAFLQIRDRPEEFSTPPEAPEPGEITQTEPGYRPNKALQ